MIFLIYLGTYAFITYISPSRQQRHKVQLLQITRLDQVCETGLLVTYEKHCSTACKEEAENKKGLIKGIEVISNCVARYQCLYCTKKGQSHLKWSTEKQYNH